MNCLFMMTDSRLGVLKCIYLLFECFHMQKTSVCLHLEVYGQVNIMITHKNNFFFTLHIKDRAIANAMALSFALSNLYNCFI